ncbi:hypothetical protein BT69DRAFT_276618 [Atractiella rhizophila]|nr:hypothetical protein BT69DRAFT_276618 [Atractiella rhizophila]
MRLEFDMSGVCRETVAAERQGSTSSSEQKRRRRVRRYLGGGRHKYLDYLRTFTNYSSNPSHQFHPFCQSAIRSTMCISISPHVSELVSNPSLYHPTSHRRQTEYRPAVLLFMILLYRAIPMFLTVNLSVGFDDLFYSFSHSLRSFYCAWKNVSRLENVFTKLRQGHSFILRIRSFVFCHCLLFRHLPFLQNPSSCSENECLSSPDYQCRNLSFYLPFFILLSSWWLRTPAKKWNQQSWNVFLSFAQRSQVTSTSRTPLHHC